MAPGSGIGSQKHRANLPMDSFPGSEGALYQVQIFIPIVWIIFVSAASIGRSLEKENCGVERILPVNKTWGLQSRPLSPAPVDALQHYNGAQLANEVPTASSHLMKTYINLTIYSLFFSIYFFDGFLGPGLVNKGLHLIPGKLSWASELLLCLVSVFLFAIFAVKQKITISINYIYFFIIFIIFLLSGIVLNALSPGTIFSGVRRYLLFWPLFFLPSVCEFTEAEIKLQMKFIAFVSILQVPFAVFQRFFFYEGVKTGDFVTGTLLSSPILTLNQLICIAVLTSFYVKGLVKLPSFLILLILFFIPTTINETKATLILFPIAIAVPVFLGNGRIINIKKVFLVFVSVFVIMLIFIPLYSYLYKIDVVGFFDLSGEDRGTKTITGYLI